MPHREPGGQGPVMQHTKKPQHILDGTTTPRSFRPRPATRAPRAFTAPGKYFTGARRSSHRAPSSHVAPLTFCSAPNSAPRRTLTMGSAAQPPARSRPQKNTAMPRNCIKESEAIVGRSEFSIQESAPGKCSGVDKSMEVENCCSNSKQTLLQTFSTH